MAGLLAVGDTAPEFTLPDQDGRMVSLKGLRRHGPVVVFFYPKDASPGCTAEACAFRDAYEAFTDAGAAVVGISRDAADSHKRFAARFGLPFTLLADEDGKVRSLYGVPKALGVFDGRVTFVVDGRGIVRHVFSSDLLVTRHVSEALDVVKGLAI